MFCRRAPYYRIQRCGTCKSIRYYRIPLMSSKAYFAYLKFAFCLDICIACVLLFYTHLHLNHHSNAWLLVTWFASLHVPIAFHRDLCMWNTFYLHISSAKRMGRCTDTELLIRWPRPRWEKTEELGWDSQDIFVICLCGFPEFCEFWSGQKYIASSKIGETVWALSKVVTKAGLCVGTDPTYRIRRQLNLTWD